MTYNTPPILCFFGIVTWQILACIFCSEEEEEEDDGLVEGLEEYYNAQKKENKAIIMGQEEYYKKNFGVKSYSDHQYEKLKASQCGDLDKIIQGVSTYRLLDSLTYMQAFQFEAPTYHDDGTAKRAQAIFVTTDESDKPVEEKEYDEQQLDATYLAIYFPYLATDKQKRINFDTSNGQKLL